MLPLMWNLSTPLNGYLRLHMPTNRVVDWLRSPPGLKWAVPVALAATPTYLFATSVCATIVKHGGPSYLNLLVLLFAWNGLKFTALAVVAPCRALSEIAARAARIASSIPHPHADVEIT